MAPTPQPRFAPHEIPLAGLGTYKNEGDKCYEICKTALSLGYRLLDTAQIYGNEQSVGRAVRDSGIPREDIWVTSKLAPASLGGPGARDGIIVSLSRDSLGLDYVDAYLLHWPGTTTKQSHADDTQLRLDAWRELEKAVDDGKAKHIGVSNFAIHHLKELLATCRIRPCLNQIEFHPYAYDKDLIDYCNKEGILVQAYYTFGRGKLLTDPAVVAIADKHNLKPADMLLRWTLAHGVAVIPKASSESRLQDNFQAISHADIGYLDAAIVAELDALNKDEYMCCPDPKKWV